MKKIIALLLLLSLCACATTGIRKTPGQWEQFRAAWIDLEPEPYKVFVNEHVGTFDAAPRDLRAEALRKWDSMYPDEPFPTRKADNKVDNKETWRGVGVILKTVTEFVFYEGIRQALF